MPKPAFKPLDALALLLLATASIIGINQYAYGVYNHSITIPFIKNIMNPQLYGNDYLIAELKYFYSLFLPGCAFLLKYLGISIPVVFFMLYAASLYAALLAFFLIALKLFERKDAAYFATMFLLFSLTTLGLEKSVENILIERTFALPLLLFSIYAYLIKHYNSSALLAGIAFLFHPLSASYVMAMLIMNMLYEVIRERKTRNFIIATGILVFIASPLFMMKLINPAPGLSFIRAGSEWLELLKIRSSFHIFPTTWSALDFLESVAIIAAFLLAWKFKPSQDCHRFVKISFFTMLCMFLIGTVFTEFIPVSIIIQFQLFRSFKFLMFFAIIYYANFLFAEKNNLQGIALKLLATALMVSPYFRESKTISACILLLTSTAIFGPVILARFQGEWKKYLAPAQLALLLAMGIAGSLNGVKFSIENAQDPNWLSVQHWANQHTSEDAVFIAPPHLEGFRVESERAVFGEWKDGTQMFFNPPFGSEWMRRMKMIGYEPGKSLKESYLELNEKDFDLIAAEMRKNHKEIYVVVSNDRPEKLIFPQVFSNEKFSVHLAPSAQVAEFDLVEDGSHELVAQSPHVSD